MDNKICYECKQGMFYSSLPTLECIKCQNAHKFNNRTHRQQVIKQPDEEQAIADKDNNRSYKND